MLAWIKSLLINKSGMDIGQQEETTAHEHPSIRVLVVDSRELLRQGIRSSLLACDDIELVGEACHDEEALRLCAELQPDVALVDVQTPSTGGLALARAIHTRYARTQVLALAAACDRDLVQEAVRAGVAGYLLTDVSANELVDSIRSAHHGRIVLSPEAVQNLTLPSGPSAGPSDELTDRERQVLACLVQGASNTEIAKQLGVSLSTVKYHVHGIYTKLGAANRAEAATLALQRCLIPDQATGKPSL